MADDYDDPGPFSLRDAELREERDSEERERLRPQMALTSAARDVSQILSTVREIQDKINYIGQNLGVSMGAVMILLFLILLRVW